jgi:hypothetical protein
MRIRRGFGGICERLGTFMKSLSSATFLSFVFSARDSAASHARDLRDGKLAGLLRANALFLLLDEYLESSFVSSSIYFLPLNPILPMLLDEKRNRELSSSSLSSA